MKKLRNLILLGFLCCILQPSFSQVPVSICGINDYPIDDLWVVTVGVVTKIVDNDQFILTSEGCEILCDGEINELPWIGYKIFIEGVIEYEKIGNDLEIDTEYWLFIDDLIDPPIPQDPPDTVFTVEDALLADIGAMAKLSGEVTEYTDTIFGMSHFMDGTGTMNMDFISNDVPDLAQAIQILGVVEFGDTAKEIDVNYWYYDGGIAPPEPAPVALNIAAADTLPVGSFCFIQATVKSWTDKVEGVGIIVEGSDSMTIDFEPEVDALPDLDDSIYILGNIKDKDGSNMIAAHDYYEEFNGQNPMSVCDIINNPEDRLPVITIGVVAEITGNDEFVLAADGCEIICDGDVNELPELGTSVIIQGVVETNHDGTEVEIDVDYWAEYGIDPSPPGEGTVFTVEDALTAPAGSIAKLKGKVTDYGTSETADELIYDNNVLTDYQALVPERVFAVKMSPSGPCEVLAMKFFVNKQGVSEAGFVPALYNWESDQPATNAIYEGLSAVILNEWKEVTVSTSVSFDGDFVVGFKPNDPAAYLAYDADLDNGRNWVLDITQQTWSEETSHTYLIRAIVQYADSKIVEEIQGEVFKLYSSPSSDGIGNFVDSTGTISMDFRESEEPELDSLIHLVGVIEAVEGTNEVDVSYWSYEEIEEAPEPPNIASSIAEADTLPLGTICFILGEMASWTNETDGEGLFADGIDSMNINFVSDVEILPVLYDTVYILGRIGENDGIREIETYAYYGIEEEDLSDEKDILTFSFPDETGSADIDNVTHTVEIELANGMDLTSLTPTFTISENAKADPPSGTSSDYSSMFTIVVTAEDGSTQDWKVDVTEAEDPDAIDPGNMSSNIQIYPIPANQFLYVESEEQITRIAVYSITGELIKEFYQAENSTINVANLNKGIYIISFFNENMYLGSGKLIKE